MSRPSHLRGSVCFFFAYLDEVDSNHNEWFIFILAYCLSICSIFVRVCSPLSPTNLSSCGFSSIFVPFVLLILCIYMYLSLYLYDIYLFQSLVSFPIYLCLSVTSLFLSFFLSFNQYMKSSLYSIGTLCLGQSVCMYLVSLKRILL